MKLPPFPGQDGPEITQKYPSGISGGGSITIEILRHSGLLTSGLPLLIDEERNQVALQEADERQDRTGYWSQRRPGNHVTQALLDAGATVVGLSREIQQSNSQPELYCAASGTLHPRWSEEGYRQPGIHFGRLDILVHTVGGSPEASPLPKPTTSPSTHVRCELYSTFYCSREAVPVMRQTGNGRIVAIAVGLR